MPKPVSVSLPHDLPRAEARRRIDEGFERMSRQLGKGVGGGEGLLKKRWTGDRLDFAVSALGQAIDGHLDVRDDVVLIEILLPGVLAMIADKFKGRLRKEGQILLEKK